MPLAGNRAALVFAVEHVNGALFLCYSRINGFKALSDDKSKNRSTVRIS